MRLPGNWYSGELYKWKTNRNDGSDENKLMSFLSGRLVGMNIKAATQNQSQQQQQEKEADEVETKRKTLMMLMKMMMKMMWVRVSLWW